MSQDMSVDGRDPIGPEDEGRRVALVKMGKFAGLTAPAVVTLLTVDAPEAWAGSKPVRPVRPVRPVWPVKPSGN